MPETAIDSIEGSLPSLQEVPGPRAWPLIGDPTGLRAARDLVRFYEAYWQRYGDIYRVQLFGASVVVLTRPDALKHVLWTNRQNYFKGEAYAGPRRVLGDGLLTLDGDAWKSRRSLAQPTFHRQSIEKLTAQMVESGARFFDELASRAQGGLEIDAHREMVKVTLDVVVRAMFGQALKGSEVSYETLAEALEFASETTNTFLLPAWLPTPRNRRFQRTLRDLDRTMYSFIATARAQQRSDSLLSMLLSARDESGAPLPDRAIRDEVMTLFVAGHETTALTLTWMFALLADHPQVVSRMQAEVDGILGDRDPSYADIAELRYLRQVIDETLRLRPPVPMIARNVIADDAIDGYRVRAGEMVMPFFWATHRHPEFWSNPLRFDPERFDAAGAKRNNSWSYVPFSGGPRVCIGNMFTLVETVLLLAQLLRRFEIQIAPCGHVKPVTMATARPSHPVRVKLRTRPRA